MTDPFQLLLAFVLGIVAYAIAIRFIPGMQPGEAKLNELLDHFKTNTAAVAANTVATQNATQVARAASPPAVAPSATATQTAAILAAAELLRVQGAAAATPSPAPAASDQTPIAWAAANGVPAGDLIAFAAFAQTCPASLSYADILTVYRASKAPAEGVKP